MGLRSLVLGILAAIGLLTASFGSAIESYAASCSTGDEIPAGMRATLEQTGLRFVAALLGSDPAAAYAAFTSEAKQAVSLDEFTAMVRQVVQPMAPFSNLRVQQIYLVKQARGSPVICGSLKRPEDRVTVAAKTVPEQAHLVVEGDTKNNGFAFVLWLIPEQDWRIQYLQVMATSMAGRSATDIWGLARDEQHRNHDFNATILYRVARDLAYRGQNFQLGIQPEIEGDLSKLQVPHELQGQPPFTWQLGDHAFKIVNVGPIGVAGKIYLYITQEIEPWGANEEADQQNRQLIREFERVFPEYTDAFAGLVVAAIERGGTRGYRTVYVPEAPPN